MKRILIFIFAVSLFTNCTTEEIVQENFFAGQSFERTTNLIAPNYESTFVVPSNIQIIESDMVLVYHLVGVDSDGFDIWRIMPDTVYTNNDQEFQYNFEHSFDFITVFIEGSSNFDFNSLFPDETMNQTFRVVILPVDFINSNFIDVNNFKDVMQYVQ